MSKNYDYFNEYKISKSYRHVDFSFIAETNKTSNLKGGANSRDESVTCLYYIQFNNWKPEGIRLFSEKTDISCSSFKEENSEKIVQLPMKTYTNCKDKEADKDFVLHFTLYGCNCWDEVLHTVFQRELNVCECFCRAWTVSGLSVNDSCFIFSEEPVVEVKEPVMLNNRHHALLIWDHFRWIQLWRNAAPTFEGGSPQSDWGRHQVSAHLLARYDSRRSVAPLQPYCSCRGPSVGRISADVLMKSVWICSPVLPRVSVVGDTCRHERFSGHAGQSSKWLKECRGGS